MDKYKGDTPPVLDIVSLSPLAASRKERDTWLGLYDKHATIEDPAGSLPYSANDPLRGLDSFYDTFIAHSDLTFHSEYDYVCGKTAVRDGTIQLGIGMESHIEIPAFLRYEVTDSGKISSLRAHWNPVRVAFRALGNRPGGLKYLADAGKRLFVAEGLKGVGGLTKGAINTAVGARSTVLRLKEYLESGRYSDALSLFAVNGGEEIVLYSNRMEAHPARYLTIGELKLISTDKMIENRNCLSLRCDFMLGGKRRTGVAFFSFAAAGFKIHAFELFFAP